jgi:hypothetical protein
MTADLSTVRQWTNKYPFDKIAGGKSLWDQTGVQAAMRAAMGKCFFALSLNGMHGPEGPVASVARVFSAHGRARRMIAATIR